MDHIPLILLIHGDIAGVYIYIYIYMEFSVTSPWLMPGVNWQKREK